MSARPEETTAPDRSTTETPRSDRDTAVTKRTYEGSGIMWSGIAVVTLLAALLVIAFQNTQDVDFAFLWFDVTIPLILILAITAGLVLLVSEVVGFAWRRRHRKRRRERDELKRLRRGST